MDEPIPISNELRLLAACDLAVPEMLAREVERAVVHGVNWGRFETLVAAEAMGGMVGARLSAMPGLTMPDGTRSYLEERARAHGAQYLLFKSETSRVVAALAAAHIDAIVLKGHAIAETLYAPHPERRYSSDIDIWVSPATFWEADQVLVAAGYERAFPSWYRDGGHRDMVVYMLNHLCYRHEELGFEVELHHRLLLNPYVLNIPFEAAHAQSQSISQGQSAIRGLGPDELIGYLAFHALSHPVCRVKWFSDVVRAWARLSGPDKNRLERELANGEASKSIRIVSSVAEQLYRHSCHRDALPAFKARGRAEAKIVRNILTQLDRAHDMPAQRTFSGLGREFSNLRRQMALLPRRPGAKTFAVLRAFSDPRDQAVLGLGRRWLWLYALLGPVLAGRRFAERRFFRRNPLAD